MDQGNLNNLTNTSSVASDNNGAIISVIYSVLYSIIVIIGIIGNVLVISVVKRKPSMRTTTNLLLANLSFADLLTIIWSIPVEIIERYGLPKTSFGWFLCRFLSIGGLIVITLIVSILLMTVVAVERYNAMVLPFHRKRRLKKKKIIYVAIPTWLAALLCSLPVFIYTEHDTTTESCTLDWNENQAIGYYIFLFVFLFILPLFIIYYCYFSIVVELNRRQRRNESNQNHQADFSAKRRVICTLVCVSVIFTISFGIFAFEKMFYELGLVPINNAFSQLSFLFVYLPSASNPIIYVFQSSNYRNAFKEMASELHMSRHSLHVKPHRSSSKHHETIM
ncbi:galanin receptor type 1-like [Exaiptasia diaphana]|uniref:G-protein coupled receptors family 1 profile domain-containing protein n=1 Tax=Exaiptasia diaphana TaxID=2652724 RepID=A0A913WYN0_EXADI|nr:galanin receptor type 1-like [Exaiptasia diaphana]